MSPTKCCARHGTPAAPSSAHRALRHGGPNAASLPRGLGLGASFGVTPRQVCPRPEGLGRNLRSKTRWFAGFCNSHQVSHFATFFIDARAEISVAESRVDYDSIAARGAAGGPAAAPREPISVFLDAVGAVGSVAAPPLLAEVGGRGRAPGRGPRSPAGRGTRSRSVLFKGHDNDPSAGSPTETLLRLLLPLNDKVQRTSRDVGGGEPPSSPRSERFTGPFNR